jgi:flagellin
MSASILTNTSAMVALQTLKSTNGELRELNNQISTGKKVASAKDNAAVFAISEVMKADVKGFQAVSDSLSLGQSTVSVASNAANAVGELLNDIKGKIISANEDNVDRGKLQAEVASLREQINGIVEAAQFNGLNLLKNTGTNEGDGSVDVLASLDRSADGTVATNSITVQKQDLQTNALTFGTTASTTGSELFSGFTGSTTLTAATSGGTIAVAFENVDNVVGSSFRLELAGTGTNSVFGTTTETFEYVTRDGDTYLDASEALFQDVQAFIAENEYDDVLSVSRDQSTGQLTFTNNDVNTANEGLQITATEAFGGTAGGALRGLAEIDVSTQAGARGALSRIEGLIQTTIDAQASLGTSQDRIERQNNFMNTLIDSFESGIGSLVDADLEEASARLQALQVQQQLGTQSLSIANQQPQNLLALFR